jgi:hypothetical protein
VSGDPWFLSNLRMIECWHVKRGEVYSINDPAIYPGGPVVLAHPSTMMEVMHGGRPPLWTRHMLGVREAERDRRKAHGRKRI